MNEVITCYLLTYRGEGADERGEHWVRELHHKLLCAGERGSLCAGDIGQPMDEVEGDVGGGDAAALHEALLATYYLLLTTYYLLFST